MEAKVHKLLSSFLAQHDLQDSISNIDDIVLSYLLGVLDLIGQGEVEDCFDLDDVTDMMNAYLPGFDQIDRSSVTEWMFSMAAQLKDSNKGNPKCDERLPEESLIHQKQAEPVSTSKKSSFPKYDYNSTHKNTLEGCVNTDTQPNGVKKKLSHTDAKKESENHHVTQQNDEDGTNIPKVASGGLTVKSSLSLPKDQKASNCKRKKRYTSVSSQESYEDTSKAQLEVQVDVDDCLIRNLLDMFPATCSMEAKHCLHVSHGDLNVAAQLIMDRQESGQTITNSKANSVKNHRKSKKTSDIMLDDEGVKLSVIEKYSYYDATEEERTHKPPPLKNEAKKLVRYRDGQIVSMKGERFSEIKKSS